MLLTVVSQTSIQSVPDYISSLSPLIYYRLNESSGTTATDSGSLSHDGTAASGVLGGSAVYSPDVYGAVFDSSSDNITFSNTGTSFSTARSVGVITSLDTAPSVGTDRMIYNEGNTAVSLQQGWGFNLADDGAGVNEFEFFAWNGSSYDTYTFTIGADSLVLGDHTYVITLSNTTAGSTLNVYMDGALLGTDTLDSTISLSTQDRRIGLTSANSLWDGNMNSFFYLNRVMTALEVAYFNASFEAYG